LHQQDSRIGDLHPISSRPCRAYTVGKLGLAASYGAPAKAFELAFEQGCNYFYLGGGRKRNGMKTAIRHLVAGGHRDKMVIAVQTYARWGVLTPFWFKRTLSTMGVETADILVLGWHNSRPSSKLIESALNMRNQGLCRFIALSGHNRSLFPKLVESRVFDLFHIRYNAAHRGAQKDCFPFFDPHQRPGIVSYTATRWGHLLDPKKMPPGQAPLDASDCYRFVMDNPSVDVCLCGPKNMAQMQTALTALHRDRLTEDKIEHIKKIGDHVKKNHTGWFG
jgi:predicted aldo/keto reductase-like oxidoreductase